MHLPALWWLVILALPAEPTVLRPRLLLETPNHAIRDIAVAPDGSIFTFDYDEYRIRKHDRDGRFLLELGGSGTEDGKFTHLTGIRALGDRLLAVDSAGLSWFDLNGRLLGRKAFAEEVTPNHSTAFGDGRYVGYQIVASELRGVLTLRSPEGRELDRLASHDLKEFFPGLKPGADFFLADDNARNYLYALGLDNDVLWAATDAVGVYRYRDGKSQLVVAENLTPVPLREEELANLRRQEARAKPPLFLYVPTHYPLLRHLAVDSSGDIWIYVRSRERTGLLRYTKDGKAKGFAEVSADFDVWNAVVRIFCRRMYLLDGRSLYVVDLPADRSSR